MLIHETDGIVWDLAHRLDMCCSLSGETLLCITPIRGQLDAYLNQGPQTNE